MTLPDQLAVIQAAIEGKEIEVFERGKWQPHASRSAFNFSDFEYRIKPDPRAFWVNVYADSNTIHNTRTDADCRNNAIVRCGGARRLECIRVVEFEEGEER